MSLIFEVCVDSAEAAMAAQEGGAHRVELCSDLLEGGLTPSHGTIRIARERLRIGIMAMIRPRGGDFCYSDVEFAVMREDLLAAKALGADHVINYKTERFEGVTRKLTAKKGVDVVFEHVGGEAFNASLFCLKRGGRLVTCGSTAGPSVTINLMQLFQQQYKIFGSFGASLRNIRDSLSKIAAGLTPIIDTEVSLVDFERGLARIENRQVFGKVIVNF